MPSKYVIRNFEKNSAYHVYNRGVEKRKIFLDKQDYRMFIYYLFIYLNPIREVLKKYPNHPIRLETRNLNKQIKLFSYCLMPNHFHLLLYQLTENAVPQLLKQVSNAYTRYFNEKYKRVGSLFQGRYKAAMIINDEQLINVVRYIHLNPVVAKLVNDPNNYSWSSFPEYTGTSNLNLCSLEAVMYHFTTVEEFEKFTVNMDKYIKSYKQIYNVMIDS